MRGCTDQRHEARGIKTPIVTEGQLIIINPIQLCYTFTIIALLLYWITKSMFLLSCSAVIEYLLSHSEWRHLVNAYEVKAWRG